MTLAMSLATWQGGEEGGEEEEKEEERQAYIKSRDPHLASGSKKTISQKHQKTSNSQKICRRFFQATRFVTTFSLDHLIIIPPLGHPNTARPAGARCAPARAVPSVGHWNFFVGHLQCQISASTATVFVVCFFKGKVNYSSLIYLFGGGMILKYTVYHIGDHG